MQTSGTRETRFHLGFYRQPVTYPHPPTEAEAVRLFRGSESCAVMLMLGITQAFAVEKSDRKSRNMDVRQGTLLKYANLLRNFVFPH